MEAKPGENTSLPHEHEDQLQLGVRIITSSFQNKMHTLQHEISGLRITSEEQRNNVASVQKKNSSLEVELVEIHQRSQQLAEENKELFKTVNSLRKQIGRLEHLKQAVLSSIQDDQAQEVETGDLRAHMSDEYLRVGAPLTADAMGYSTNSSSGVRALAPPMQPLQPPSTAMSAAISAQRDVQSLSPNYSAFGQEQAGVHGVTHANNQSYQPGYADTQGNQVDSFQGPSAIGGTPVIDGKQFFRQARSRLSYESFNLFLASIKRLNNQQQSREETLEEARGIFGPELQDLYMDFENLLNRHGM